MKSMKLYDAIKRMRLLSENNIPFSFEYVGCNMSLQSSGGLKVVDSAKLRVGLSTDKGIKSRSLIGYIKLGTNDNRWFYLPLLMKFNEYIIND